MQTYEYKVVPAPAKGEKAKGIKSAEGRFAFAIERVMNDMAAEGWEYQRAETLPSEERSGLTSSQSVWRNLLVFRRPVAPAAETVAPTVAAPAVAAPAVSAPVVAAPAPAPAVAAPPPPDEDDIPDEDPVPTNPATATTVDEEFPALRPAPRRPVTDNGVELTEDHDAPSPILTLRAQKLRGDTTD
ncbi:DUF4177 domain-containing protein [Salipiger sp.]|uniref:DUF4177 domain-containing protein n=1 Tax=Salipiger sp. TaxID=2078585 RepID=UPI003A97518F